MPGPRLSFAALLLALCLAALPARAGTLSGAELDSVGRRVWRNECGGRRDGLTSWNRGEQFASLGIGHFIWYPEDYHGPFDESFPRLAQYLADHGAEVPDWALGHPCPWASRTAFLAEFRSPRMVALRALLAGSVRLQAAFIVERMEASLPRILEAAPPDQRENVRAQFERLRGSGRGTFALIDYVNFKGEGTSETERYHGEGWGLLQVLTGMKGRGPGAVEEFAAGAAEVLTRRVANSPPVRGEARWLPGWKNRVRGYLR